MKKTLLGLLLVLFCVQQTQAQTATCGFEIARQELYKRNPSIAIQEQKAEQELYRLVQSKRLEKQRNGLLVTESETVLIPVVVHVLHTGGAVGTDYNPSDADIMGAIDYMNEVFNGTHSTIEEPIEGGGKVNLGVQFALAQRTPECGATNGINRVDASSIPKYVDYGINASTSLGISDQDVRIFVRWDPSKYYNIYLVNKIDGKDGITGSGSYIAGYAYFANEYSNAVDGTYMLASKMRRNEKTLPHELGHAFNLHHTFNGNDNLTTQACNITLANNCETTGDGVCDTDPVTQGSFMARTGPNQCANGNPYTRNTESNFMSYTNSFTLFTHGQQERLTAALSFSTRISLINAASTVLSPCGGVVNYSSGTYSANESQANKMEDCRYYRDYSFQILMGEAPNAAGSININTSGTATYGTDYDIFTNGNLTTPNKAINLIAGDNTSKTFTVRIYDDANVEGNETIQLTFTINGATNLEVGTTNPSLTFTINDNDYAPSFGSQTNFTNASNHQYIFMNSFGTMYYDGNTLSFVRVEKSKIRFIYTAQELISGGLEKGKITNFKLYGDYLEGNNTFANFRIKMVNSTKNYMYNFSSINYDVPNTEVYATSLYTPKVGENNFDLSSANFEWDGESSIIVEICYDNTYNPNSSGYFDLISSADETNNVQLLYVTNVNCESSFSGSIRYEFANGLKPKASFTSLAPAVDFSDITGSGTQYVGVGSNEYLYTSGNGLIAKLSGANTDLGCVTSTIVENGTEWADTKGLTHSPKLINITPTYNQNTATYSVSLYYKLDELNGLLPANIKVGKTTANSFEEMSPANFQIDNNTSYRMLTDEVVEFTATFTGFSNFFIIDGSTTLPVELVYFNGKSVKSTTNLLEWATALEQNSKAFEIEHSIDGANFHTIGAVNAKGTSNQEVKYNFTHSNVTASKNWYRLKQLDTDGKFSYSNVVLISTNISSDLKIYPVPATHTIIINFGSMINKTNLDIYSADMKLVQSEKINIPTAIKEINISRLSAGVYFIKATIGDKVEMIRFVKQ